MNGVGDHGGTVYTTPMLAEALAARARNDDVMSREKRSREALYLGGVGQPLHGDATVSASVKS